MNDPPGFDPTVAFQLTFADVGPKWQCDGEPSFYFDRHLRYAESIPAALVGAAQVISERTDTGRRPEFPFMSFGLVDTVMFNCFARREGVFDRYHAGMSVVVPLATLELACHYFSLPDLFPNIGSPERGPLVQLDAAEHPPLFQLIDGEVFPRFLKGMDEGKAADMGSSVRNCTQLAGALRSASPRMRGTEYFRNFDALLEFMLPECPVRRMHCEYMSYALLHFLWIHEIAHLTNGHLIELRQRTGQQESNFHEFFLGQFANSPLNDNIDCLAMEFDADIEAAAIMLSLIMSDIDIESDDAPYVSRYERVTLFTFALAAFYTSAAARELASERLGTHPPAMLRLENILVHLAGIVREQGELQQAIVAGYLLFQSYCDNMKHSWIPLATILPDPRESIGKDKWWEIYQHRQAISTGYNEHRLGNLRAFMVSLDKELRGSPLFQLGPEPDWWDKDT